jgi:hypothetical protein
MKPDSEDDPEEKGTSMLGIVVTGIFLFVLFQILHQLGCAPRDLKG